MQAQFSNLQSTERWMLTLAHLQLFLMLLALTTENPNRKQREQNVVAHATIWKALHVLL
jgi:hypothetical protein